MRIEEEDFALPRARSIMIEERAARSEEREEDQTMY